MARPSFKVYKHSFNKKRVGMSFSAIDFLWDITKGAAAAAAVIVASPVLGAVGAITATGAAVALGVGAVAATVDAVNKDK